MNIRALTLALGVAVLWWLYSVYTVGLTPAEEDAALLREHCEMVQIYRDSGGELGWPDYNNRAHLCARTAP